MAAKYKEFSQLNLPLIEQQILAKWEASDTFNKSESIRQGSKPFIFYEGPPSANGLPGIHHVIGRTLKDLVCRYKTMQNFQVKRKGGWDTHGLPVELGVEKLLGITKEDIGHKISVADYNTKCREEVLRFKDRWEELTLKMGYWVNLDNPYITFTNEYIETLWWCLKTLHGKKLLYKSVSIQPYSPAAGTGLSSHELNQPGTYRDVKDTSVVAMFRLIRNNQSDFLFEAVQQESSPDQRDPAEEHPVDATGKADLFFLAWTTTPWTLPSNLGLTVGSDIDYVLIKTLNPYTHLPINVILAKSLVHKYFKAEGGNEESPGIKQTQKQLPWKLLATCKGDRLEGIRYEQLLPYEANHPSNAGGDPSG